ncbi:MAG TPA: type 1 glutamine amidotransferase domain-containing protein, partial [Myxococcota bacterium]|nr:type 1 glutamine amidotransferase domain-containing protein [Myxococcota bacterium]
MELEGKRVAVLIEELFNEHEVLYPYYRLKEAGAEVRLVGTGRAEVYRGKSGLPLAEEASARELGAEPLDAVVVPGGFAPDHLRRDPATVALVRRVHQAGGLVATICHGGWLLCSADIAAGRLLTSFESIRDDLVHAGAGWLDEDVVVDGNLITSRRPEDLPAFMRAVIGWLRSGAARASRPRRRRAR